LPGHAPDFLFISAGFQIPTAFRKDFAIKIYLQRAMGDGKKKRDHSQRNGKK
jgi:hypothetical protein